jgi:15-cis-phytoene desaturase
MTTTDRPDVVIVGGGLAGLTAGVGLAREGIKVHVLEREPTLGGRASSWVDPATGDSIDVGPHIFLSIYWNMFRLLDDLGTRHRLAWHGREQFLTFVRGPTTTSVRQMQLPPPMSFLPSVLLDSSLSVRDKVSNFAVTFSALQLTERELLDLDDVPAREFLREMGVTDAYITAFWSFVSMAILNCPLDRCSTASLLRFYRMLVGRNDLEVGFADGGLSELFADQARRKIESLDGRVETNAEVVGFTGDRDAVRGVSLADGRQIDARFCISALPADVLGRLARREWFDRHPEMRELERFERCPYLSTYLWFDRKLTKRQFWARAFSPHDFNCDFYDLSNIRRGWKGKPSVIASNIIYSHRVEMSDDEVVKATRRELAEFLPAANKAQLVHSVVNRVPMAVHTPATGTEKLRLPARTEVRGLVLAGDWTRTGVPSSMEGACRSGWLAAEEVLAARGRPRELAAAPPQPQGFSRLMERIPGPLRSSRTVRRAAVDAVNQLYRQEVT